MKTAFRAVITILGGILLAPIAGIAAVLCMALRPSRRDDSQTDDEQQEPVVPGEP